MKAFQLIKNGTPQQAFQLNEVPDPQLTETQVLIKVDAFGLNFADVMARLGLYRDCPPLPAIIGYDVEGHIEAIGSKVEGFDIGDRVFGLTRFGGYADKAAVDFRALAKLPGDAADGVGTALATQYCTAYYAAEIVQTLIPGEIVLIHAAAGGVGTALIQLCKRRGCIVIGTCGSDEKIEYLKSLGVDCPIQYRKQDFFEEARTFMNGRKLSAYFDNLGGKSIQQGKKLIMPGGRVLSYGGASLTGKKSIIKLLRFALGFGWFSPISYLQTSQAFIGINMLRIADYKPDLFKKIIDEVSQLYSTGAIPPTIGKVFPASELAEAHAFLENRKSIGKIAVKW